MKKKFRKRIPIIFIALIIIFMIIIACIFLPKLVKRETHDKLMPLNFKNRIGDLAEYSYKDYLIVGWLQVQGTNIDYPILNSNAAAINPPELNFGWRSSYYITGQNREVLLGHNVVNVSSNPVRDMSILSNFEGLMAFTYEDFAKENLYISYTKGNTTDLYKIYAVGFYDYYDDDAESFANLENTKKYINKVRKNSIYDYDIDVNENDYIITLKTCTRYFGLYEKQQFYVDARKVREDEEIVKYEVTANDNYNILANGVSKENG